MGFTNPFYSGFCFINDKAGREETTFTRQINTTQSKSIGSELLSAPRELDVRSTSLITTVLLKNVTLKQKVGLDSLMNDQPKSFWRPSVDQTL